MSLNIKNEGTHALVRELATLRGVSQTEAVDEAVRVRLRELTAARDARARYDRAMAIAGEMGRIVREPGSTLSTADLYDERGVPR